MFPFSICCWSKALGTVLTPGPQSFVHIFMPPLVCVFSFLESAVTFCFLLGPPLAFAFLAFLKEDANSTCLLRFGSLCTHSVWWPVCDAS